MSEEHPGTPPPHIASLDVGYETLSRLKEKIRNS
jgi:hypothetical protein